MGTGIDTDVRELAVGACRACLLAGVPVIVCCRDAERIQVLVDRSVHGYLMEWLHFAMRDPVFEERTVRVKASRSLDWGRG